MRGSNPSYATSTLDNEFFKDLDFNVALFLNERGESCFRAILQPGARRRSGALHTRPGRWLAEHPAFSRSSARESDSRRKVIRLPSGAHARGVPSHPHHRATMAPGTERSSWDGSWTARRLRRLAERLRISLAFLPADTMQGIGQTPAAAKAARSAVLPYLDTSRESELSAYSMMRD